MIFVDETNITDLSQTHYDKAYFEYEIIQATRLLLTASFTFIIIKVQLKLHSLTTNNIQAAQIPCFYYCHNFIVISFDNCKLLNTNSRMIGKCGCCFQFYISQLKLHAKFLNARFQIVYQWHHYH